MKSWWPGEGWGKGIVREFGMGMSTLLYLKWITNKDLLYRLRSSAQCYAKPDGRAVWGRMDTRICTAEPFCCLPDTVTTVC